MTSAPPLVSSEIGRLRSILVHRPGLEIVRITPDNKEALREQWGDGNNTLALEPGVVVAYERNQETNRRLRGAGVEVIELSASELCRGREGSRCMTQLLLRDSL